MLKAVHLDGPGGLLIFWHRIVQTVPDNQDSDDETKYLPCSVAALTVAGSIYLSGDCVEG